MLVVMVSGRCQTISGCPVTCRCLELKEGLAHRTDGTQQRDSCYVVVGISQEASRQLSIQDVCIHMAHSV